MKKINKDMARRMIQTVSFLLVSGVVLFAAAGTVDWPQAWSFIATGLVILVINLFVLPAEVIEERGRKKENVKKWDTVLTRITGIPYFSMFPLCGFDHRFGWSPALTESLSYSMLILYFLASMVFTWAMVSNRFFSTVVRIQEERGHAVETGGPYRYVRHPGYLAFIIMSLTVPVILGSLYSLILSAIVSGLFIIRTTLEDKTLLKELNGYDTYALKVKYRLIPFIW